MLEQLFGSKTRVKLLWLFLNNPKKAFYVRELGRLMGTQINSIRRELNNLEKLGIIGAVDPEGHKGDRRGLKRKMQQKKYFQANSDFLLFSDLKSLFLKAQVLLEKDFVGKLVEAGSFYYLVLTGVFTGAPEAAVDILMVGRVNRQKIKKLIKKFEKEFGKEINYTIMNKQEFEYRFDIIDRFLYNILENKKIIIVDKRR